jgi:hypothetical protein
MIFILEWDSTWGRRSTYYVIFSVPPQTCMPKAKGLTCLAILVTPVYYIKLLLLN